MLAHRFWSAWKSSLIIVTPETVVRWHRARFRLYSSLISRVKKQVGRKSLSKEIRTLIFRMVAENPTWGPPRIHGELLMLGFDVPERSISPLDEASAQRSNPLLDSCSSITTKNMVWSTRRPSLPANHGCANLNPKPLAKNAVRATSRREATLLDVTRDSVACVGHGDSPSLFTSDLIRQQASKDAMAIPDTVGVTQEGGTDRLWSACSFFSLLGGHKHLWSTSQLSRSFRRRLSGSCPRFGCCGGYKME